MGHVKWLGPILLLCTAYPLIFSTGELEEAMQWMMMEEVEQYVQSEENQTHSKYIDFVLYKKGPGRGRPATIDTPIPIHNGALNAKYDLRICVFGWQNDLRSEFTKSLVKLFTNQNKFFQVVVVNWKGASLDYVGARRLVPYVAETVHKYLLRLEKELDVDLSKLTIIGHGFGAHIAGAVGHIMRGNIGTIIALDPMAPLFWENTLDTVNASSANNVIGVHTSAGYLGVYWNVGHVDFWVNRGSAPQPGCYHKDWRRTVVCSHEKSFRYFIEAATNPEAFHSVECGKKTVCTPQDKKTLETGFFTEKTKVKGQFCFNTNPTSPYSLKSEHKEVHRQMRPWTHMYSKKDAPRKHKRFSSNSSRKKKRKHSPKKTHHVTHRHRN